MKKEIINVGDFTEQITWKVPAKTRDSFGQTIRTFSTLKTDWVDVQPVAINESEISNRLQYTEIYNFTGHNEPAINNTYQIEYNSAQYNIIKIQRLNLNRFIRVTASKIVE